MNAAEIIDDNEDAPASVRAEPSVPRRSWGRRLLVIGLPALLAIGGGAGAYLYFAAGEKDAAIEQPAAQAMSSATFVDAPVMLINVHDADGRAHYLKLRFVVVTSSPAKADEVKDKMPIVVDALQSFLRELRPEDLAGSAAVYRIKEEIMVRMRRAFGAASIEDVLIQDLVEQ